MKMKYKLLLLMIALCLPFLLLGSLFLFRNSVTTFITVTVAFYALTYALLYFFYVRRIERLNKDLSDVQLGSYEILRINVVNQDELSEIASRINVLLETLKLSRQQLYLLSDKSEADISSLSKKIIHQDSHIKLPDSAFFNEALNKTLSYVKRHHTTAAVLIINVDMKNIMDNQAHLDAGVINEIAKKFTSVLRKEDLLAKLDGHEFVVLLEAIEKPKFASAVAEKLLQVLEPGICVNDKTLLFKTSVGVCVCPHDAITLEEAIEKTYTALYRVKSMDGNHYQFYTKALDEEAHEYIRIKGALHEAIQNNELVLYYQPKVNLKKGSVEGAEVLIRWLHPTLGLLAPDKFLDIAEDSNCILAIGDWALREACKMNVFWQSEGYEHITVALNLSIKQFFNPELLKTLTSVLQETKLNPSYLELEVSEATIMSDLKETAAIMKNIAALGVQISIDHFGKGYTSMSHLKHLPINTIKIDRSFVDGVPLNPNDSAITSAIIALAHYLGIFALAEGVENAEQLQFLSQQHCDIVQGYFLSYPLPAADVVDHFKKISDRALS